MKIDAHHHCWRYTAEEFDWINYDMRAIRRDFFPVDLAPQLAAAGLNGTVVVQARQTLLETRMLLELARQNSFIKGVVGWVPLIDPQVGQLLDGFKGETKLKGVRHVLQGEPDDYMSNPAFDAGLKAVAARGLRYDLLVKAPQLPAALKLVDRHSTLSFVLDHIAKPAITGAGAPPPEWRKLMTELARRPHVCCKFSGVVTEVHGYEWTAQLLKPYFDIVLHAFGPERLMFGSDWPVCLVASDYVRWFRFVEQCTAALSPAESRSILGGTAARFYRLTA